MSEDPDLTPLQPLAFAPAPDRFGAWLDRRSQRSWGDAHKGVGVGLGMAVFVPGLWLNDLLGKPGWPIAVSAIAGLGVTIGFARRYYPTYRRL